MRTTVDDEEVKRALRKVTIACFAAAVPITIWQGAVVMWMWEWFAVPFGVPALGLAHAIGVGSLVSLMTFRRPILPEMSAVEKGKSLVETVVFYTVMPTVSLLTGAIVHGFMP